MPLVIDNENMDEIIARFVFDKDLFTVFFRKTSCGVGAEGENFCAEFNKNLMLRGYHPQVIINDVDPRHRHFQRQDRGLVHVHVGFDSSIEHIKAVKAILIATSEIQKNVFNNWSTLEKSYNEKLKSPICGTILFSNLAKMVTIAEKFLAQNTRFGINNNFCFWGKSNGETQSLECKDLVTNIPTQSAIFSSMQTIIALSQAAEPVEVPLIPEMDINFESPSIQGAGVTRYGELELIVLLLVCMWLLKNLFRPIACWGLRR